MKGIALALVLMAPSLLPGAVRRLVVFKFDGVNADLLDRWLEETEPRTSRSKLPWMQEIFARQGTRLANFYVLGISLSAPSWALLDTGHHQVIRGNVEYDRWTLHAYDYLNFFPFYFEYAEKKRVDMPGVEVLDNAGVKLLIDRFPPDARRQSYQLYQRENRWNIIRKSLPAQVSGRSPKELFDEWQTGFDFESGIPAETERQLIADLRDDSILYLDFFSGDWDHVAHLTGDSRAQLRALQNLDALIGRIWTAVEASPGAAETAVIVVSDHGMNTSPSIVSQGYNLVSWFNSAAGGAQNVITNRHPLSPYKLRGLDPFLHKVLTPTSESSYLKTKAEQYPTVLLDLDGNERAAVQLRSNDWNVAQILLQALRDPHTSPSLKIGCHAELQRRIEAALENWRGRRAALLKQLDQFAQYADAQEDLGSRATSNKDLQARRTRVSAVYARNDIEEYRSYITRVDAFLKLPVGPNTQVPQNSLGGFNSVYDLQNYVVGPSEKGLQLNAAGYLDLDQSFRRIDYFAAMAQIRTRNQVQRAVSNKPVDFLAAGLDTKEVSAATGEGNLTGGILLCANESHEALVLYRESGDQLFIRYVPISGFRAASDGKLSFQLSSWQQDLPLRLWEDDALAVPSASREEWLAAWHDKTEWFGAVHNTAYSNGIIGIVEQFRPLEIGSLASVPDFQLLRRELVQPDFLVFASDHWNFNARNFNPGGNHGSFLRTSTHSVLMFWGGESTGIPRGLVVDRPYDSLSFTPTLLKMVNRFDARDDLPGPAIDEVLTATGANPIISK